jgi:hypothetical protein
VITHSKKGTMNQQAPAMPAEIRRTSPSEIRDRLPAAT